MHVASRELCSELHKLSGWYDVDMFYVKSFTKKDEYKNSLWELENYSDYSEHMTKKEFSESNTAPAYDLGFLLRELPKRIAIDGEEYKLIMQYPGEELRAHYWNDVLRKRALATNYDGGLLGGFSKDKPEDSIAELAIKLFKQGILTPELSSKEKDNV